MENKSMVDRFNQWIRTSISIKIISIAILVLLLLIPTSMIQSLISERRSRSFEAIEEVSDKWADAQILAGPILNVPYIMNEKNSEGGWVTTTHYAHFLPEKLNIEATVEPEIRYRGIYKVVVYKSQVKTSGNFLSANFDAMQEKPTQILWDRAFINIGIADMRGIQNQIDLIWNNEKLPFNPGTESNDLFKSGAHVKIPISDSSLGNASFQFSLDLNGSKRIMFVPMGKETHVQLESPWKTPSFTGSFLPDERSIHEDGFNANWRVLHLNRNYPQQWSGEGYSVEDSSFGVELLIPVDEYQKSERAVKYAIMIIALTFLIFFFVEVLNKNPIHPFQYILTGLALCLFYSLLLAMSEHLGFNLSYVISAISILGLITWYCQTIFKNKRLTSITALIMTFLYAFVFFILQLEDYSLLIGSIGLFILLAIVMYVSRKIKWYGE